MILSEIYQMHDRLCAVVLDPESGTLTPIRVVNLDTKELTPQFFSDARAGFPDAKPFRPYNPNSLNWLIIEKYGLLVASINNLGGFIVFESPDMIPLARSLFSKKARLNYERRFPARETRDRRVSAQQLRRRLRPWSDSESACTCRTPSRASRSLTQKKMATNQRLLVVE